MNLSKIKQRLEKNSTPDPNTGCRLWIKTITNEGYGLISIEQKLMSAHRAAWILEKGEIPTGKYICHKCDTRACINIDHLFLGTAKENIQDAVDKKRMFNTRKTKCKRGHDFDRIQISRSGKTWRSCSLCRSLIMKNKLRN